MGHLMLIKLNIVVCDSEFGNPGMLQLAIQGAMGRDAFLQGDCLWLRL